MKTRFYSKIDWWIGLIFVVTIILSIVGLIDSIINSQKFAIVLFTSLLVFMGSILFGTYYEFRPNYLLIASGPFYSKLPYNDITKISFKKSSLSASALSTDRIEILCNGRFAGYVSPKDKEEFIKRLESKCVNIKQFDKYM